MLPSAAAAFAIGILAWPRMPGWVEPLLVLGAGLAAQGAGWLGAAAAAPGEGSLVAAGLVPSAHPAVEAVATERVASTAWPLRAVVACLLGTVALGAWWSGIHHRGLDAALLASLAPGRVEIEGILKTDPRPTASGWSATAQVRWVAWSEGDATMRSAVWVGGY